MLPPLISDVRDGYILDWWGIDEDSPEFSRLSENIKKPFAGARNAASYKLHRPLPDPPPRSNWRVDSTATSTCPTPRGG